MSEKMRIRRPAGDEYVDIPKTVRISEPILKELQARRKETGVPISTQMRQAIEKAIYPSGSDTTGLTPVKVIGPIPAGTPREQEEYTNKELICSFHPSGPEYAYVKVDGDSMNRIIPPGAFALVRKMWAMSGAIIAAKLTMPDGSVDVTLKRMKVGENNQVTLEPDSFNGSHKPLVLSETKPKSKDLNWIHPECAEIVGVFTGDYVVVAEK